MLSSSKDLCLIFIKAAEGEGALGGAAAPGCLGRSDDRSQRRGHDHAEAVAAFPAATTITITGHRSPRGKPWPSVRPSRSPSSPVAELVLRTQPPQGPLWLCFNFLWLLLFVSLLLCWLFYKVFLLVWKFNILIVFFQWLTLTFYSLSVTAKCVSSNKYADLKINHSLPWSNTYTVLAHIFCALLLNSTSYCCSYHYYLFVH